MYKIFRHVLKLIIFIFFRISFDGLENFPKSGAVVVCANHTFMKDLLIIGCLAPRKIRWLAKSELFRIPVFGQVIRLLGAFPLHRGEHDRGAVRQVYKVLRDGEPLGIFPEGTRVVDPAKRPAVRRGFVTFAVNSGAPILPVSLRYKKWLFAGGRLFCAVHVAFGKPIYADADADSKPSREAQDELACRIMDGIYADKK